jgi:hypothetical protein
VTRPGLASSTRPTEWTPERIDQLARALQPLVFGRPAHTPADRCDHGGLQPQHPMNEIERFRWQLISTGTINPAFAAADINELLAQALEQLETAAADKMEP